MKKILFLLAVTVTALSSRATSLPEQADSAYNNLAYAEALRLYNATLDSIGASPDLYYNIGNTYYRLRQPGMAILLYERALMLDPTHEDARANLEFVNTTITDRPVDNRSLIKRRYDSLVASARPDTWAWLATAFFAIAVAGAVVYLVSSEVTVRKICFFGGLFMLGVAVLLIVIASAAASATTTRDKAIVISPAAHLYNTPRSSSDPADQAFLLHEGTKVTLVDSIIRNRDEADRWYEVRVGSTGRAWINCADIEKI